VPLIDGDNKLPDTAFSALSSLSPKFKPEFSRLDSKTNGMSSGSWSPAINDQMQYLQITFPTVTPIYGVIMRGNSFLDQYVTSFKILHSFDGVAFHYLYDESRTPQIFRGPADSNTKASSLFEIPIEAKAVRIYPISWHKSIAVRAELLGCALNVPTTPKPITSTTTPASAVSSKPLPVIPGIEDIVEPMCDDPMGVDNGQLAPTQIKVSSSKPGVPGVKTAAVPLKPSDALKLTAPKGWQPMLDTPNEFVVFDFLEPRNLTGVKTKGGNKKWVTVYNVLYSKDNKVWNKILTPAGEPKEFLANVDPANAHTNLFQKPIRAQYLKVAPVKWHEGIEMQVEPLGCFKPYRRYPVPFAKNMILSLHSVYPSRSTRNRRASRSCVKLPNLQRRTGAQVRTGRHLSV
jgi:von Willebrand factor